MPEMVPGTISTEASVAAGQKRAHDLVRPRVGRAGGVRTATLLLVATRTRDRQIAGIVGTREAARQIGRGTPPEPAARNDVLEG